MPLSKRAKVLFLVVPPVIALGVLTFAAWADQKERNRLDDEQAACLARCEKLKNVFIPDPPAGQTRNFTDEEMECLGFHNPRVRKVKGEGYDYGDGCVRGITSDYDWYGLLAAGAIGIVWGPWAFWMMVLAMIHSVIRTVQDAKKPRS